VTWRGPDVLEPLLVPIGELEPFPGNPRRGDVARVAESLTRFGQMKPIVRDGNRIVAGHHVVRAAELLEWTHVAAVDGSFPDDDEQRAYMLADNRTSDVGDYSTELLLAELEKVPTLEGTGYSDADLDELRAQYEAQMAAYDPNLEPLIATGEVTDEDLAAAQAGLGAGGARATQLQILCPACGHSFYVQP
jgi:ParB-like chromosome segregation protein Spo0J